MSPVAEKSKVIYTAPGGREVTEFSHSQFTTYNFCPKRYEIERVKGWRQKPGANLEFGHSAEEAIRRFYKEKADPVETFEVQWQIFASDTRLEYPDGEDWKTMREAGVGLMERFKKDWQKFPPRDPVFPNYKNRSIVRDSNTGTDYATIPDVIDIDEKGRYIADIKCLKNTVDIPLPHQVTLDSQLRTQAAATKIYRVALWNFSKQPKRLERADRDEIFRECAGYSSSLVLRVAHDANDLNFDDAAKLLGVGFENPKQLQSDWKAETKANGELKLAAEKITASIREKHKPVYVIQWLAGEMTPEHALEAIRHEMSVVPLIQIGYFPRNGGVRFPDNQCTWCPARGLCLEELYGYKPEYEAITREELVKWDEGAMEGL